MDSSFAIASDEGDTITIKSHPDMPYGYGAAKADDEVIWMGSLDDLPWTFGTVPTVIIVSARDLEEMRADAEKERCLAPA